MSARHLVVVGGGIAGLAAAWEATQLGWTATVVERRSEAGGKLRTTPFLGRPVDEGADAFLRRVPDALALCEELGIRDLRSPSATRAMVWQHGSLRRFPDPAVMGVPLDPDAGSAAEVLSPAGRERLAAERGLAGLPIDHDVAVGPFLRDRLGSEVADGLVGALLGGIAAGDPDRMSLDSTAPQLAAAARRGPSLLDALAAMPRSGGPVFAAPPEGMQQLPATLAAALVDRGVEVRTDAAVASVEPSWLVHLEDGSALAGDAVVVAAPAPDAARILPSSGRASAEALRSFDHASVVLVTLGYRRDDLALDGEVSGFVVPRSAGLRVTAASWASSKWPHWADRDHHVLRVSMGHRADPGAVELEDDAVLTQIQRDLGTTMRLHADPVAVRVSRWRDGFLQHDVGHAERVGALERTVRDELPGLALCGAGLRGVGVPASIASGRRAAGLVCAEGLHR
jgi:oxygen-dependent protoporphyrinogen oxidase